MASTYCLPKSLAAKFLTALRTGALDVIQLSNMDSLARRKSLEAVVGELHAEDVNVLFEKKLLQKNQMAGLLDWAKTVGGLKPGVRDDIIAKIQRMNQVLNPASQQDFLADLAKTKLGFAVNAQEATDIFNASTRVEQALQQMQGTLAGSTERIAYGNSVLDFKDMFNKMKPNGKTWVERGLDVLNISRALQTTLDLSAVFNQGWGMLSRKQGWEGFGNMFKYLVSEKHYRELQAYIISHPNYEISRKSGLALTDLSDRLSLREEEIQSTLVEKANQYLKDASGGVVPNIIRGSNRAYTGYLNYVRFHVFNELIEHAKKMGEDVQVGSQVTREIANSVNDFTGRGNLGKNDKFGYAGPLANLVLYAPRKISATLNMLNPVRYLDPRISKTARVAAARQLFGSIVATTAVLTLAQSLGATVDLNPTSSNFLSAKVGEHSVDLSGGNAVYLRFLSRFYNNSLTNAAGKEIDFDGSATSISRGSLTLNFARNKLSPMMSLAVDAAFGKDAIGRPFDMTQETRDRVIPISAGSIMDYFNTEPEEATRVIFPLLAIFGSNLNSPLPAESKFGTNVWGEVSNPFSPTPRNAVDKEAFRLGVPLHLPLDRISGIKLTDDQYKDYIILAGQMAKQQLEPLITNPQWGQLPDGFKATVIKNTMTRMKTFAQEAIKVKSLGSDNDLVQKYQEEEAKKYQ